MLQGFSTIENALKKAFGGVQGALECFVAAVWLQVGELPQQVQLFGAAGAGDSPGSTWGAGRSLAAHRLDVADAGPTEGSKEKSYVLSSTLQVHSACIPQTPHSYSSSENTIPRAFQGR